MKRALVYSERMMKIEEMKPMIHANIMGERHPEFNFVIFPMDENIFFVSTRDPHDEQKILYTMRQARMTQDGLVVNCKFMALTKEFKKLFKPLILEAYDLMPSHPEEPNIYLDELLKSLVSQCSLAEGSDPDAQKARAYVTAYVGILVRANTANPVEIFEIRDIAEKLKISFPEDRLVQMQMDRLLNEYPEPVV